MQSFRSLAILASLAIVATVGISSAQAEEAPSAPAADRYTGPSYSLTFSPAHLIEPLGEFTGEYRLMPKLGVAAILGVGSRSLEVLGQKFSGRSISVGAQASYYVFGDFAAGMQAGLEILHEDVAFDDLPATVVDAAAGGTQAGAFVGYKIATKLGFTFVIQAGVQYLLIAPKGTSGASLEVSSEDRTSVLANLNLGWSF